MLAHKATHEGKVAAEVIAGQNVAFDAARDPVGRLHRPRGRVDGADRDSRRKADGIEYEKAVFPWAASGRALVARPRRGHDEAAVRARARGGCSAPGSSGVERRRADRRDRARASRWAPTPRTSGSRSTRTRRSRRRGVRGRDGRGDDHRPDAATPGTQPVRLTAHSCSKAVRRRRTGARRCPGLTKGGELLRHRAGAA